jgi:uncharacterized protein YjbJ (UPF0337 family)
MRDWLRNWVAAWRRCGATTSIFATRTGGLTPTLMTGRDAISLREGHSFTHRNEGSSGMNWDTMKGDWKQFKGKVKEQWGQLTDDDLDRIEGKRDQLLGAVQKRYGIARDEAERQLKEFETAAD